MPNLVVIWRAFTADRKKKNVVILAIYCCKNCVWKMTCILKSRKSERQGTAGMGHRTEGEFGGTET